MDLQLEECPLDVTGWQVKVEVDAANKCAVGRQISEQRCNGLTSVKKTDL